LGAILTLSLGLAAAALAADKPQPKTVVANPIHDFGPVDKTAKLTHEFEIRNEGNAELRIREARADCACAVTTFDQTIAAAASGKVSVVLDPVDLLGPVSKVVTVFTNDPAAPEVQLTLKAVVRPALLMKPGYVRYLYVQQEQTGVVTQTVWAADAADFRVVAVKSPYSFVKTAFWEAKPEERLPDHPGKQWRISTTIEPDAPVGPLAKMVEITTDHPHQKSLELPISGFVRPIVAVTPPSGDLGTHKRGEPFSGSLKVQTFSTEPIAVTEATSDIKGLGVKLETVTEGRVYKVRVILEPDIPVGQFSGTIKIKTASPKIPVIDVPLTGTIE
jgi:hypothetical protein